MLNKEQIISFLVGNCNIGETSAERIFNRLEEAEATIDAMASVKDWDSIAIIKELESCVRNTKIEKDNVYRERNRLVCALSKLLPSHISIHPEEDKDWGTEWRTIICIHGPSGQMTWHIHDSEIGMFKHLLPISKFYSSTDPKTGQSGRQLCNGWDGHTTEEKYKRLEGLNA